MEVIYGHYAPDGRLRGCYVYMLLCRDEGPVYVKLGTSINPHSRLRQLRYTSPVTLRQFCSFEVPSRFKALLIERELRKVFRPWEAPGEWYTVPLTDKGAFNRAWQPVLAAYHEKRWPCVWNRVAVPT